MVSSGTTRHPKFLGFGAAQSQTTRAEYSHVRFSGEGCDGNAAPLPDWAHRQRTDGRQSPAEVLGWVHDRQFEPEQLHRVFYSTRFGRKLNALGYVCFRKFRVYGERGLSRERAAVWLYGENLTLEYADEPLSRYKVTYQPDRKHLLDVGEKQLYNTPHRSPQQPLWELGDGEWLRVVRVPAYALRKPRQVVSIQAALPVSASGGV